jgi:hypothetical protein
MNQGNNTDASLEKLNLLLIIFTVISNNNIKPIFWKILIPKLDNQAWWPV